MSSPLSAADYLAPTATSSMAAPLAALGPWMLASAGLSTVGGLIGSSQQANSQAAQGQMAAQFNRLAPINQRLTYAGQELMASIAPYLGAEAAQTQLYSQAPYDQFSVATDLERQRTGFQTGVASALATASVGQQEMAAKGRTAMELLGGETQADLTKKGADVLGIQYTNLAKGLTDVGSSAANLRNQQVLAQQQANLAIGRDLSLVRANTLADLTKRREARGALGGGFA